MTDTPERELSEQDLIAMFEALQKQNAEKVARKVELQTEISQLQHEWQLKGNEKRAIEDAMKTENVAMRELEKRIERSRRLANVEAEQEELRKRFLEKAAELDALTSSAKWREFAFDHQIQGGKVLAVAKRGILADKRGLGKTLTSLIWADMVEAKKIVVIAPNDVVPQFEGEIRTWAPSRTVMSLRGMPKGVRDQALGMLEHLQEYIITINYEAWRRDKTLIDDLVKAGIDTIICDEAHRIKSSDKVTARGVHQIAYRPNFCSECNVVANFGGNWWNATHASLVDLYGMDCPSCGNRLSSTVENVLAMSGTPILNKPQELFSILFLVNRRLFPKQKNFIDDYCIQYAPNRWRFISGGLERLTHTMKNFFLQRTRDEAGITLPPPAITIHEIEKDKVKYKKQYEAEKELTERAALHLGDENARKDFLYMFEIMLRERQMMTWPAGIHLVFKDEDGLIIDEMDFNVEESQKLDEIEELLDDLCEEEERVVVFSQFKAPLYELQRRLVAKGISVAMATGDQTDRQKQLVRDDFDLKTAPANPRYQICLATYKAFGTGINLNGARHVVIVDDEWNPGMEDQAIGRIDRMNSVDQANVHIFRVTDSVDDYMAALLDEKRDVVNGFEVQSGAISLQKFFDEKWNL
jgi:SNF2 family DNA or RNA helicase